MLPPGHAGKVQVFFPKKRVATPDDARVIDAHVNRLAGPDHERRIHPDRRTICGSPAPLRQRPPTPTRPQAREARARIVVSSRSGEFKADPLPISRESDWEGKCAISTGRCSVVRNDPRSTHMQERYPHVPDGASRIGVDHTAAESDRDGIWIRRWRARRTGAIKSHPTLATIHAQTAIRPRCRNILQLLC